MTALLAFIRALRNVDRRVVYVVMVVVLSIPFLVDYSLPIYPDRYTRGFYETIEGLAENEETRDKVVMVLSNWGPGTKGENEPQFEVIMRHLLRRKLKFVFVCSVADPAFHDTAMLAFEEAKQAERERARRLNQEVPTWEYGVDYLDFGYRNALVFAPFAQSVIAEAHDFYQQDYVEKRSLLDRSSHPLLREYKSVEDVSAVIVVSAADEARDIVGLVKSDHPHLLVAPATMGIVANDLYPYVKSGHMFGLLNSARAASEYRVLLDPESAETTSFDNAMSLGKTLLLVLVVVGNIAFVVTRRAERSGRLRPVDLTRREPLPPLPAWLMWSMFGGLTILFLSTATIAVVKFQSTGTIPRERVAQADDDPNATYAMYERVDEADLQAEALDLEPPLAKRADEVGQRNYYRLIERRIGEFIAAFLTLGVFAFCLGDNRLYRFVEGIILGGSMAYMLDQLDKVVRPDWFVPIYNAFKYGGEYTWGLLWILLLFPASLWYFTYSKRYRWLNQLIVAFVMGLAIGPEFNKQINLLVPQVIDTIQPLWPWAEFRGVQDVTLRIEHLFFVLFAVLSLTYFIFSFRPKSRAGQGMLTAGRLAMMIGFGAMFGNTVNTRLSWLAPRIQFLWEDWLGKLFS